MQISQLPRGCDYDEVVDEFFELIQKWLDRSMFTVVSIFTHAPLRPGDFACVMACDENQVVAVFDLLVDREVLDADSSVECWQCQNLMPHADFQQAVEDEER